MPKKSNQLFRNVDREPIRASKMNAKYQWTIFLVVFSVTVLLSASSASVETPFGKNCGPNEVFTMCGTACPATCNGRPDICTYQCIIGCQCEEGYVLKDKKCILPSEC